MAAKLGILLSILILGGLFVTGCSGPVSDNDIEDQIEEADSEEPSGENNSVDEENNETGKSDDAEPFPGSFIEHEVDMKVNGVVEENKGEEEWWVID